MQILKKTGNYLDQRAKLYGNISTVLILVGIAGIFLSYTSNLGLLLPFVIILATGGFFFRQYSNYSGGLEAENSVTKSLSSLDDRYCLLNDVKLRGDRGNIDHIVLGPNGVFVIETKNYSGKIICNGDEWIRQYEGGYDYDIGSPSKQVKRNAVKIKHIIESSKIFKKPLNIWVEGIVVFTKPDVNLQIKNATVSILKIDGIYDYIKNKNSRMIFSSGELDSIGKTILRQSEEG
ncbi:hypothetical protein COT29_03605 [Candidatus Micrarchaeota archaeon CG08_land_8_20_14_0_20_59_11]|nr:MAG: hypothetical protein COT29_03605 [Candidatus Micrarchaeota archaeon CG08_land_8_20_14_0_20_59_11]